MKLHRFNDDGMQRFLAYLDALRDDPGLVPPDTILTDPSYTVPVTPATEFDPPQFANRMEAARFLDGLLSDVTDADIERDVGLWSWLTLLFFDQVCPVDGRGRRKIGERARYVPAFTNFRKYYRHLLAGPFRAYLAHREHPTNALIVLCGPLDRPGDIVEQLLSRQEIVTNSSAMAVATELFYDPGSGSFRRGAASKARRLADLLNQFDLTWDLNAMPPDRILTKMPREFDRFRPKSFAS